MHVDYSVHALPAILLKSEPTFSASAIINGQPTQTAARRELEGISRDIYIYITATMVTHCTYIFPLNAFRVINRVKISVSTPSVKKRLVSSKQKALRPRVKVHAVQRPLGEIKHNYFHIFAVRALKSSIVKKFRLRPMVGLCKYGHIIIIIIVLIITSNIKRNNDNYYGIPRAPRAKSAYFKC